MTTNASRAAIDIDAFERELKPSSQEAGAEAAPQASTKSDPLAELARIVGQDDPFRALLAARGNAKPVATARLEPSFGEPAFSAEATPATPTPADAFDQYLASVEQDHRNAEFQDPAAFESDDRTYANAALAHPRRRGRLMQVGAGLGVLVLCVTGALAWKGLNGHGSSGGPVTVLADRSPLKVAPEKADGVDIPDQNKQIYERNAKDGQIKIVNREEQPVDVAQAARSAGRDGGVTPGGGALLTESLGEPRKIRTVAVKPDTPPPAMQQQREAQAEPAAPTVSAIPTMMMPDSSNEAAATQTPAASRRPPRTLAAKPAVVPAQPAAAQTTEAAAVEPATPAPTPSPRKPVKQRVASLSPETTASTSEPEAPAASEAPAPTTVSTGGFAVQLGVRNSEADARAAFEQFQGKYSQLAGKPALIRQAEVNGKSLYRVRVGPLGKSEANSLCSALKGSGAACFVAAN